MNVSKWQSKYVRAEDVKESGPVTLTITSVEEEQLGQGENQEDKPVLYAKELEQGVVLAKVNINTLVELFGSKETDEWIGKRVVMYHDPTVLFQGKRIGGIRFREAE